MLPARRQASSRGEFIEKTAPQGTALTGFAVVGGMSVETDPAGLREARRGIIVRPPLSPWHAQHRDICHEFLLVVEASQFEKQAIVLDAADHRHRQTA
jgi:hypothetical protein